MTLAKQTSFMPTNKLMTGSVIGPLVTAAWAELFAAYPAVSGPGMAGLVGFLAALALGYFIPDAKNESAP